MVQLPNIMMLCWLRYPHGRESDDILLNGRILAITDAYSAMTLKRVYRKYQFFATDALIELKRRSGSPFDPRLVDDLI